MRSRTPFHLVFCFLVVFLLGIVQKGNWANGVGVNQRLARKVEREEAAARESAPAEHPQPETKVRRGGVSQRLNRHQAEIEQAASSSSATSSSTPITEYLNVLFSKGTLSSVEIQKLADKARRSGAQGLDVIAEAGTRGNNPQNLFRSLKAAFGMPLGSPDITWFEVPMNKSRKVPHPFLLPHTFFKS